MSNFEKSNDQWIPLQIKVFTRWFNSQLKQMSVNEIRNIIEDLSNGVSLVELVQYLTKKSIPRPYKKDPTRSIDMVQNCDLAIEMLQKEGINIVGISGKDIHDKNEKLILGLIWSLILRYSINRSIQNSDGKSQANALLMWAIDRTKQYQNVNRFEPYQLAICALLDSFYPEKINYSNLDSTEIEKNLNLASNVMKELGIDIYIYPEDVIKNEGKVDEKALLTQLAIAKYVLENPKEKLSPQNDLKPFLKKTFLPDDPSGDDVISYAQKLDPNHVYVACSDENVASIMKGDPSNHWQSCENARGITEFKIGFTSYSLKLQSIYLHTGSDEYPDKTPNQFYVFGYDSHEKHWEVIYIHGFNSLETNSLYSFKIDEDKREKPYRCFGFLSCTGPFALAYIKLFGEVVEETDFVLKEVLSMPYLSVKKNYSFECIKVKGKFTDGVLASAMKLYGPELLYFIDVKLYCHLNKGVRVMDLWSARNKEFKTLKKEGAPAFISLVFLHNEVFMTGYQLRPTNESMASWVVIGCKSNDDEGVILDHQKNCVFKSVNSYYGFQFQNQNPDQSFRIIRFVGLTGYVDFQCFDIFGKVVASNSLTDDDVSKSISYPPIINQWVAESNSK